MKRPKVPAWQIKLPSGIEAQLSEDERRCFYSLSEEQRRPFLKQAGVIPSVSGTASVANKLSRIAVNCQAGSADRKDRLQAEIIKILTENIGMTWRQVARELDKTPWLGCQGDIYKWVETDGREGTAPYSGIKDRVSRAREHILLKSVTYSR
jgi:hypothetical protein